MVLKVLVDSSALYALFSKDDPDHEAVRQVFQTLQADFILPQVVLTEAAFLFNRAGGMRLVAIFLELLTKTDLPLEPVTYTDLRRATELLRSYHDTKLELVDCCLIALAERLTITHIATLDRRDFAILRTKDGKSLTILP
ncbi:MAG: PIN domain-containing protein [Anaerolineae bacterium]|nr:PIN domain-containing protein [Anaerolineae bacterium]